MRRKDRERDKAFACHVADQSEVCYLGLADKNATPYCVPLNMVREGDAFYFHCAKEGKKIDMMRQNPLVSVACTSYSEVVPDKETAYYSSAIFAGRAEELTALDEKLHAMRLLCNKLLDGQTGEEEHFKKRVASVGVWKITITEAAGKQHAPE